MSRMTVLALCAVFPLALQAGDEARWDAKRGYWNPNTDEAKVAPYALEDPLAFESGRRVESVLDWPARRAEILDIFAKRMFGAEPPKPEKVTWDLVNEKVGAIAGYATRRVYRMTFTADKSGPAIDWGLWLPRHAKGPVPVVVFLNYRGIQEIDADPDIPLCRGWSRKHPSLGVPEHRATEATRGALQKADNASNLPIQSILARGYAILSASYTDVSPDPDAFGEDGVDQYAFATTNGVFALWGPRDESRTDNITSLGAWAWALSRGLDLARAQPEIDRWRTVVTGCSRLGKAAFLAAARDPRFAVCVPNQCGGGGVCLGKRDFGENVSTENAMFTHWYCRKYRDYAANPAELMDFDMHLLVAAIAPRRILVEGFGPNDWMDTKGEYLAVRAASPVWDFWGLGGLPDTGFPDYYDTAAIGDYVGYVRRTEGHGISGYDWKWMLDFADNAWKSLHPQARCFQKPFWYGIVEERQKEVRAAQGKTVDLVLIGDSITSNWDRKNGLSVYTGLTNAYRVVNLGVPSDRTDDIAWRCRNGQLDGYRARYAMVFAGTNDIWQEPAERTAERVSRLVDLVRFKQPGAKIILMAPFPLENDPAQAVRKPCAELKTRLRAIGEKKGCIWMDFEDKLLEPDGSVRKERRPDGVHIGEYGYRCWREALERVLAGGPFGQLDLQARIDAAVAKGGGTVEVPAGEWEVKPIRLGSNVTLHFADGARIFASTNIADYCQAGDSRCFIYAENAENVSITGGGVIDGRGRGFREVKGIASEGQPKALPLMMRFSRCRNVLLEDFTYRQAGAWGCHLRNCDGVVVRRVKCYNHNNKTNDGIDIESANVLIEDCDIDADDDAVVLKSESDVSFAVTNVTVRNSRLASICNAFKIGTGTYGDVSGVRVENCTLAPPRGSWRYNWCQRVRGVTNELTGVGGLALECVDGGRVSDIVVRNVTIDGYHTPVFIRFGARHDPDEGRETFLKDILIENVKGGVAESPIACSITGVPGRRVRNVVLRNVELSFPGGGTDEDVARPVPERARGYPEANMFCNYMKRRRYDDGILPAWGFYLRHADDVTFERVRIHRVAPDARKPIVADDCENFQIRQGLRGAAPYRLVAQEGTVDRVSLVPDFTVTPSGIDAWADRFETVGRGAKGALAWAVFRERSDRSAVLVYAASADAASDGDFAALRADAARAGAAIVGCRAPLPGTGRDAQRNSPEWDLRATELRLWYDAGTVTPYEFRIDASRKTPEVTKGAAHVFDFSLRAADDPASVPWDPYVPARVAAGEFSGEGPVVYEPKADGTPIRTLVEAGETLLGLREAHPGRSIVLKPLVGSSFDATVNAELRKFAALDGVSPEGFPPAETAAGTSASAAVARTDADSSTRGPWWWFRRLAQKNRQIARSGGAFDLVMVGDSITHFLEGSSYWTAGRTVQDALARRMRVLNLGYGGDTTQSVLWRLENGELDGYRAKWVSLMIGTNNRTAPEETAEAIGRILALIARKQPDARVILTAILPRGEPESADRKRNARVNELIRPLADDERVVWLDLSDRFLQADGRIAPGLMTDEWSAKAGRQCLLHPYELGYEIWKEALEEKGIR